MKDFSLDALRERLLGPTGFEFFLSDSMVEAREVGGLASSGHAFIGQAIGCVLVGFLKPAEQLFVKARDWINEAISLQETPDPYFPHGTEAIWYGDLATAEWFLTGEEDLSLLNRCVDHQVDYLDTGVGDDLGSVGLAAVDFLLASRCKDLEDFTMDKSTPRKGGSSASELDMALHWCDSERTEDLRAFMAQKTRRWLENGHYQRSLKWIRLGNGGNPAPPDTIKEVLQFL